MLWVNVFDKLLLWVNVSKGSNCFILKHVNDGTENRLMLIWRHL